MQDIVAKTDLRSNDKLFSHGSMGAAVRISTEDGRSYSIMCEEPPGSPGKPVSDQDLFMKYRECTRGILDEERVEQSMCVILDLEKMQNVKELIGLLTA